MELFIKDIYFVLYQDSIRLPTILVPEESEITDEVKEEAKGSLENFLQVRDAKNTVLTDEHLKIIMTQSVIFFYRN